MKLDNFSLEAKFNACSISNEVFEVVIKDNLQCQKGTLTDYEKGLRKDFIV